MKRLIWWRLSHRQSDRQLRSAAQRGLRDGGRSAAGQEAKSDLDGFGKWLDFGQKLFTVGGAAIGAISLLFLLTVGRQQSIVIEKFSVADDVKGAGYDDSAIARQLADSIRTMVRQTTSLKDHRAAFSFDAEPLVAIEASSMSARSVAELVNRFRAKRRYAVTGEVTHIKDEKLNLTVRVEDDGQANFSFTEHEMPSAINQAAEYVLSKTEPYIFAAHLLTDGRDEEALKWIRICIADGKGDNRSWAYNLWGVYFLERRDYGPAIEKFQRALGLDPRSGVARFNLGQALERQGRTAAALKEYRAASALTKPQTALSMAILDGESRTLARIGQSQEAINLLTAAVNTAPDDRPLHFALAKLYVAQGDYNHALPHIQLASESGELDLDIDKQYALILDQLGKKAEAISLYRSIVAADPKAILYRKRLETLLTGGGAHEDAN